MRWSSSLYVTTLSHLRRRAWRYTIVSFAVVAVCTFGKSLEGRVGPAGTVNDLNLELVGLSLSISEAVKALLETIKSIFEALGSALLIYSTVESVLSEAAKRDELVVAIDDIQYASHNRHIIDAITRDLTETAFFVDLAMFFIHVRFANEVDASDGYRVSQRYRKTTGVVFKSAVGGNHLIERVSYSGDPNPWTITEFKIVYGQDVEDILAKHDKTAAFIEYQVDIDKLRRNPRYDEIVTREKTFYGGILENHIFTSPTFLSVFTIIVQDKLRMEENKFPIHVFLAPSEKVEYLEGTPDTTIADDEIAYRCHTSRTFLPNQGFTYYMHFPESKTHPE